MNETRIKFWQSTTASKRVNVLFVGERCRIMTPITWQRYFWENVAGFGKTLHDSGAKTLEERWGAGVETQKNVRGENPRDWGMVSSTV